MPSPSKSAFDSQQDSLAFLKNFPPRDFGGSVPRATADVMDTVPSSQADIDTIPATQEDSTGAVKITTEQSQAPDLTQDQGRSFMSPIKGRSI